VATDIENRMREIARAISVHDVEKVLSFFADDIFYEEVGVGGEVAHGKEELRIPLQNLFASFPDITVEITSYINSEDRECVEWTSSGTHKGDIPGLSATGKRYSLREVIVTELRRGKISRFSLYTDMMTIIQQLGAISE
jgi:steroid delta-isomerase-like uncharacterized protein